MFPLFFTQWRIIVINYEMSPKTNAVYGTGMGELVGFRRNETLWFVRKRSEKASRKRGHFIWFVSVRYDLRKQRSRGQTIQLWLQWQMKNIFAPLPWDSNMNSRHLLDIPPEMVSFLEQQQWFYILFTYPHREANKNRMKTFVDHLGLCGNHSYNCKLNHTLKKQKRKLGESWGGSKEQDAALFF